MKKQSGKKQHKIHLRFKYQLIKIDKNMTSKLDQMGCVGILKVAL